MRVILLAAGYGTRLRPITDTMPKCLVPIKGKPLLEIWLEKLSETGFGPFLINTHYLSEQVEKFIKQSKYRDQVTLVHEPVLLGTAGTLIKNLDFFESQDGMLIHADNYCMADLREFVKAHKNRTSGCVMTMMTFRTENPESCGIVEIDSQGVVQAFYEKIKSTHGNLANGAIYVLSNKFLESIPRDCFDFSTQILPNFIGRINSYKTEEIFMDIGTIENYAQANC